MLSYNVSITHSVERLVSILAIDKNRPLFIARLPSEKTFFPASAGLGASQKKICHLCTFTTIF